MISRMVAKFLAIIIILVAITVIAKYIIIGDYQFRKYGSLVELNQPAPVITIGSTNGTITIPIEGKVNIMTPQYTHCPDICPLETVMMLYVMNRSLEYGYADDIVFITINVDPWRDDAVIARQYMEETAGKYLNKIEWIWLVDTPENMWKVWDAYKVAVEKDFNTGLVAHTGGFYIIDKKGIFRYYVGPTDEGWRNPREFAKGLWIIVKSVVEGKDVDLD